jgi:hypothetical protein
MRLSLSKAFSSRAGAATTIQMHSAMLRAAILFSGTACWALKPASRRQLLHAAPAVAGLIAAPAVAEDFQASLKPLYKAAKTAKLTYRSKAGEPPPEAWAEDAFVGRYTDPINHPGGIRDISLTDTFVGEYRLVKVVGGGGRGEPEKYVLPGLVDANRITVDFSVPPKGGPPNLTGVLTLPTPGRPGATAIVWPDGNKWPQERK